MKKEEMRETFSQLLRTVRLSAIVAYRLQGRVLNDKKSGEVFTDDTSDLIAKRAAKTVVDEIIQEQILLAAADVLDLASTSVDAEESTPSTELYSMNPSSPRTLVVDPIDGTLEYLQGLDSYSICLGLTQTGRILLAIVYFVARDTIYCLGPDGPMVGVQFLRKGPTALRPLTVQVNQRSRILYHNSRVPRTVLTLLSKAGFEAREDTYKGLTCPDAILSVSRGLALCYLAHTRQMRDILMGAIVSAHDDLGAFDWKGNSLQWPAGGRVPRSLFCPRPASADLLGCLAVDLDRLEYVE